MQPIRSSPLIVESRPWPPSRRRWLGAAPATVALPA